VIKDVVVNLDLGFVSDWTVERAVVIPVASLVLDQAPVGGPRSVALGSAGLGSSSLTLLSSVAPGGAFPSLRGIGGALPPTDPMERVSRTADVPFWLTSISLLLAALEVGGNWLLSVMEGIVWKTALRIRWFIANIGLSFIVLYKVCFEAVGGLRLMVFGGWACGSINDMTLLSLTHATAETAIMSPKCGIRSGQTP
jgi:hypothetical protein